MNDETVRTTTPDQARTAGLGGAWRAAVCIDANGEETLWLLSPEPNQAFGCACATCAPHDQLKAPRGRA